MNYFDDEQNARSYIEMVRGDDGAELVTKLTQYLPDGSRVLELGMGPGTDLQLLSQFFQVVGSDRAQPFLDLYRAGNPEADLLLLDAVTLETDRKFDGIYSNKVLHHLSRMELAESFVRQPSLLEPGGIALHSFWRSATDETYEENHQGLRFVYYRVEDLTKMVPNAFEVLECAIYAEMEPDDSICLVLQRR